MDFIFLDDRISIKSNIKVDQGDNIGPQENVEGAARSHKKRGN